MLEKGLKPWVIIWKLGESLREDEKKRVFKQRVAEKVVFSSFCDAENWDGDVGTA